MVDLAGQQIGHYHLAERIASGGMADIYLASHTYLDRRVAVKILHSDISEPGQEAFLREARLIASLKHPNIVPIYDFGIHSGGGRPFAYLVMEYAYGNLAERHPPGSVVPFSTIRSYVSAIASALQYAHTQNIVHRDVKPSNILIGENDTLLLSDFGIATFSDTAQEYILTGTPVYMPPEQVTGGKITASADQYALGVVIYQWLCGFPPFVGDNQTELMIKQVQEAPTPLRSRIPSIPAEIDEIVLKALAKSPEKRFSSVRVFADTLDEPLRLAAIAQPFQGPSYANPYATQPGELLSPSVAPWSQPKEPTDYSPYQYVPPPTSATVPPPGYSTGVSYPDLGEWGQSAGVPYYKGPPTIVGYTGSLYADQARTYVSSVSPPRAARRNGRLLFIIVLLILLAGPVTGFVLTTGRLHAIFGFVGGGLALIFFLLAVRSVLAGRPRTQQNSPYSPYPSATMTPSTSPSAAVMTPSGGGNATNYASPRKNFCIVYHHEDHQWAEWIAWHLEEDGFTCILPDWDFQAGSNFDLEMTRASTSAERIIVILSPTYVSTPENLRTVRQALSRKRDIVLPIVVHEYDHRFKHPLRDLVALNLVNLNKEAARVRLISVAHRERQKPPVQPIFPPELELINQPRTTIPGGQPAPLPTTQTNMAPGGATLIESMPTMMQMPAPVPVPVPQNNLPPNQTANNPNTPVFQNNNQLMGNPNITIVVNAADFAATIARQSPDATVIRADATLHTPPGGNKLMTIEQNALKVATFLKTMRDQVIANPEFGKRYTDAGRMDDRFTALASNLELNFQRLQEARDNAAMNPGRRQYQEDIDNYLQGLSNTSHKIELLWYEFRTTTTTQIEDLQQKVELESEQEEQEQQEQTQKLGGSAEDAGQAERKNWFKTALNGLVQFKDFLLLATDIDKAVTSWTPTVMDAAHHAFNALSMLHF